MNRRNILKATAFAGAGAGLSAFSEEAAKAVASTASAARTPFIVTRDGANLFYAADTEQPAQGV